MSFDKDFGLTNNVVTNFWSTILIAKPSPNSNPGSTGAELRIIINFSNHLPTNTTQNSSVQKLQLNQTRENYAIFSRVHHDFIWTLTSLYPDSTWSLPGQYSDFSWGSSKLHLEFIQTSSGLFLDVFRT